MRRFCSDLSLNSITTWRGFDRTLTQRIVTNSKKIRVEAVIQVESATDRTVDVLGNGFVRRLVLTADRQPNVAFVPLDEPAVSADHRRQSQEE